MDWRSAVSRIFSVVAAGGLVGWYLGDALAGIAGASVLVLLFWSWQIWRVENWLRDSSTPPPDVHGVWGDIVARIYKQQREAKASEERLQSTVDYLLQSFAAMRDGVVIVEAGGGIRWCNEAAQTLLALRYPDDVGQAITNLVREPEFSDYIHSGDYAEPLVYASSGLVKRHLQLIVTQFAEGDTLLFIREVTDRVRTEQMRRDFVGNVSHELRTPLTVITGYLETLLTDPEKLPRTYVRALEQMQGQAARMENLLKDLLWLSRIEATQGQEKHELVDMAALLYELQDEVSGTFPGRELNLELLCSDTIRGDHRELYSAVSNLVYNALKYSKEGSPVIAAWRKEGEYCRLDIRDQGVGIDPVHFPRLTERFYRVDDSRSASTGGTGLGLAIVKHVAAAHDADLGIDSTLGQGSTFSLRFPATEQSSGDQGHAEAGRSQTPHI
ncbi:phosphate regulon sensor histidine kinase PhoR [Pseudohalioglobus lutimaris]|uniref:Phosphate regulon sensor protein PhoR n=1 Tax=Pseudohalioglobus lutimaris TaxID=1737061 RepID=A0A2N5WYP0_9GAMM|nr:phosphate regulon sensor histidine kinase PhoR [Pseudohalioglobus lutimaris]PLW67354.1 phosphate regulon sensor histidine kinase PhoR [Pseudohalioglobus lutimaris]